MEKKLEVKYTYHEDVDLHSCEAKLNGESIYTTSFREKKEQAVDEVLDWLKTISKHRICKSL